MKGRDLEFRNVFSALFHEVTVKPLNIRFTGSVEGGLLISLLQDWNLQNPQTNPWSSFKFSSLEKTYGLKRSIVSRLCRKWAKLGFLRIQFQVGTPDDNDGFEYMFLQNEFAGLISDFLEETIHE